MTSKLLAIYRIRATSGTIDERARSIAVEQSVEMPVDAIDDEAIRRDVVGSLQSTRPNADGTFDVTIAYDTATTGFEPGQLMNVLFGNTSLHDDVTLVDIDMPAELTASFCGPRHGPDGLRARVGAGRRALTCSALKPLGLPPARIADLAHRLALGGIDYIKDDHGLADQRYAPFEARIEAVAAAVRAARDKTGKATRYLPNISGNLDAMRSQLRHARAHGLDTILIAPMIVGMSAFQTVVRENADMAFIAHPALAGCSRIAPEALLGKLFPLLGADGVIFPNVGGRFGYSAATCRAIAANALHPDAGVRPSLPVPAGGMKRERIPEILAVTGPDAMLLIGGDLLAARDRLTAEAEAFQRAVERFAYEGVLV